jgi:hypothetical protein
MKDILVAQNVASRVALIINNKSEYTRFMAGLKEVDYCDYITKQLGNVTTSVVILLPRFYNYRI